MSKVFRCLEYLTIFCVIVLVIGNFKANGMETTDDINGFNSSVQGSKPLGQLPHKLLPQMPSLKGFYPTTSSSIQRLWGAYMLDELQTISDLIAERQQGAGIEGIERVLKSNNLGHLNSRQVEALVDTFIQDRNNQVTEAKKLLNEVNANRKKDGLDLFADDFTDVTALEEVNALKTSCRDGTLKLEFNAYGCINRFNPHISPLVEMMTDSYHKVAWQVPFYALTVGSVTKVVYSRIISSPLYGSATLFGGLILGLELGDFQSGFHHIMFDNLPYNAPELPSSLRNNAYTFQMHHILPGQLVNKNYWSLTSPFIRGVLLEVLSAYALYYFGIIGDGPLALFSLAQIASLNNQVFHVLAHGRKDFNCPSIVIKFTKFLQSKGLIVNNRKHNRHHGLAHHDENYTSVTGHTDFIWNRVHRSYNYFVKTKLGKKLLPDGLNGLIRQTFVFKDSVVEKIMKRCRSA